jgi:hypothetical protein
LKQSERHGGAIGLAVLPKSIQLLSLPDSIQPLAQDIEALEGFDGPPAVICIDTLSRNAPGAKENAQEDMSLIVAACDYLRLRFGCTVILAHHTRKGDDELRGSSVLDGAADTCILLKKDGTAVTVSCVKQKDAAPFEPFTLTLTPVVDSCVLRSPNPEETQGQLTNVQRGALQCLREIATSEGCSNSDWLRSCTERGKMSTRSFFSSKNLLLERGYVLQVHGGKRYAVSPDGVQLLQLQSDCNATAIAPRHPTATPAGGRLVPAECSAEVERGDAWEGTP